MAHKCPTSVPLQGTTSKQVTRGYRFRFYPNQEQEEYLAKAFGSARFVYNKLLESTKVAHQAFLDGSSTDKPQINNTALSRQLTQLKQHPDYPWLKDASCTALQESCFNLVTAYQNYFAKRTRAPKFRSKYHKQSISFTTVGFSIQGSQLKLAKLSSFIKLKLSRELPAQPTRCTISKTPSGEYYASLTCTFAPARQAGQGTIGIDAGITDLATFSDGTAIANPRYYLKLQKRLAMAQRRLSRKKKASKNRAKQKLKLAQLHAKIASQRQDYLHKLSSQIVRHNQAIAIESLQVANLLKNHKLAKHIADAGWGIFRDMLTYKVEETSSGYLFLADPYFPSTQQCSTCLARPKVKLALGTRKWQCEHCGTIHLRDHNAAKNLEGLAKVMLSECLSGIFIGQIHLVPSYRPTAH